MLVAGGTGGNTEAISHLETPGPLWAAVKRAGLLQTCTCSPGSGSIQLMSNSLHSILGGLGKAVACAAYGLCR